MILIDLNQTLFAGIMAQIGGQKNLQMDENLIRHMVLNIIRSHVRKFRQEYGEIVLCCDSKTYWRKEYFPYYKANRKANRESSSLDWNMIFTVINKIRQELKDNFPYKVLEIDRAEADDIIGTLVPLKSKTEKVLIISTDGDFLQLQQYPNVEQYSPIQKKFLKSKDAKAELHTKIIEGDKGDGIPNILSASDTFVRGVRQVPLTEARMSKYLNNEPQSYDETARNGYSRNEVLINLTFIPEDIQKSIIDTYNNTKAQPRTKLIPYFMSNKLKLLMEVLEEF